MEVVDIPFVKHVGIETHEESALKLEPSQVVKNHIETIHASAQFALAETQSGLYLQTLFPEYVAEVLPLLRSSTVKYKSPATSTLTANASVDNGVNEKFVSLFERKGRGAICVNVELKDEDNKICMIGEFTWFIQKVENET